jgi:hypothetical protein
LDLGRIRGASSFDAVGGRAGETKVQWIRGAASRSVVAMRLCWRSTTATGALAAVLAVVAGSPAYSQEPASAAPPAGDKAEMAKKLANPISDLVSVPFQFNWEQGVGPQDQTRFILNIQPVMPFTLNKDWNLIARVITPLISQPPLSEGGSPAFGVGDVLSSFFFSPSHSRGITWGVGSVLSLPSTTIPTLGTEK